MRKKVLLCFGTRPEAIKMASLAHELKSSNLLDMRICVTAQHREMLDQVLNFFGLVPDYDLDIMRKNQSLNQLSGRIFLKIDEVLLDYNPDIVLVHGDTTTSSLSAWAAFHRNIKVGHVEAGLRTYDKFSPFPEEMNRQITGRIADFHFTPTIQSQNNLLSEKIDPRTILVTGNTVIDSLLWTAKKLNEGFENDLILSLHEKLNFNKKIILVTGHRRENFGDGFLNICKALRNLSENKELEIVYPVHLNPNVQKPVMELLSGIDNIHLIDPLDYPSFVWLMKKSFLILTDSGGVQEEAPSLGKPVLVMRDTTERPEAVNAGTVLLVGTDNKKIIQSVNQLINDDVFYNKMALAHNPYGDGKSGERIVSFLERLK